MIFLWHNLRNALGSKLMQKSRTKFRFSLIYL